MNLRGMWLSWADVEGFNGACVIAQEDFLTAVKVANLLNIRPAKGGQCIGVLINFDLFKTADTYRLLTAEDCKRINSEEYIKL